MPLDEQHTVSVFPFVDGTAGNWGDPTEAEPHAHRYGDNSPHGDN